MPGFVQIMEIETSRIEEVEALSKKMQEERGDALLVSRATVTQDRIGLAATSSSSSSTPTNKR